MTPTMLPDDPAERTLRSPSLAHLVASRTTTVVDAAARTAPAPSGRPNEDAWGIAGADAFVVADGIGGRPGGRTAAGAAVDALLDGLASEVIDWASVVAAANDAVRRAGHAIGADRAGCVVAGVRCRHDRVTVLALGDVRVYRVRARRLQRLTQDHSVAGAMADLGVRRSETGLGRRELDAVTSYLGDPIAWTDFSVHELTTQAGDRLIVCTDGVYRALTIEDLVDAGTRPGALASADALVERAVERRTPDDATALVIDLAVVEETTP